MFVYVCLQATVRVPDDALVADFVFLDSDNEQSGFYDNNNGLDYHVPVFGAQGTLPPLRIAHVSVEMAPIAKVGGMGDVVTALGRAVQEYGHEVEVSLIAQLLTNTRPLYCIYTFAHVSN